ncbi:Calmodulin-binding protein 60 E [Sarracenia purpurea var. burkii]
MEGSGVRRLEKRVYEESSEDHDDGLSPLKKPKLPGLASVIVEALKVDSLQKLCSSLEPLFRKIVSEEVERALTKLGNAKRAGRKTKLTQLDTDEAVQDEVVQIAIDPAGHSW